MRNAGFELGDQDWTKGIGYTIENDAVNSRSGAWVSKFTGTSGAALRTAAAGTAGFPFRPGAKISLSVFIDSSGGTAGNGRVRIGWRSKDGTQIGVATGSTIAFGGGGYVQSILTDSVAP